LQPIFGSCWRTIFEAGTVYSLPAFFFFQVPTLKECMVDVAMPTWRGLAAPKGIPPDVLAKLNAIALKTANEPAEKEAKDKQNLGYSVADGETFRTVPAPTRTTDIAWLRCTGHPA
jgi:tripartite-type tricarboxylate transporter receptor subunit TctC